MIPNILVNRSTLDYRRIQVDRGYLRIQHLLDYLQIHDYRDSLCYRYILNLLYFLSTLGCLQIHGYHYILLYLVIRNIQYHLLIRQILGYLQNQHYRYNLSYQCIREYLGYQHSPCPHCLHSRCYQHTLGRLDYLYNHLLDLDRLLILYILFHQYRHLHRLIQKC